MKKNIAVIQSVYRKDNPVLIERSITSILEQDCGFDHINYYLCIDGPIDEELQEIVNKYRSNFFKIVTNDTSIGLAAGLNKLINLLENEEYIFRMDSDDFSSPERVRKQIEFLEENQDVGICGTSLIEIFEDSEIQKRRDYYENHEQIVKEMYKCTAVGHPTVCFRRDALRELKGYNEAFKVSQDIEMWFRAVTSGIKFHNICEPLFKQTVLQNFYSRRSIQKAFREFSVYWVGCNTLYGFSWRNLFPLFRLFLRFMPHGIIKILYKSNFRDYIFNKNTKRAKLSTLVVVNCKN